ncbi:hypothetical protein CGLO_17063 [Colletotrichum gloeosporioides Cg-14]|uniref:Uncharacterized protein n=1 Tax=Colletotrichum gloeosporioides (strain Cg-14) TaxID=1237896 RepID=T0KXM7_COLGC|nr:hypothetical protein CGLO_17063 [Colletotrichum gloeosporioides Cg-14]
MVRSSKKRQAWLVVAGAHIRSLAHP